MTIVSRTDVSTDHLDETDISGYIDDDLSLGDRRRVDAHLDECGECRSAILEVMRAVESFEPPIAASSPVPARPRHRRRWSGIAAGVLAAGLIAVLLVRPESRTARSRERSAPQLSAEGRQVIDPIVPAEDDSVAAVRPTFQWHAAAAERYRVVLMDEAGAPVWTVETRDTVAVMSRTTAIVRGKTYWWRVDGISDGLVATSGAHRFVAK